MTILHYSGFESGFFVGSDYNQDHWDILGSTCGKAYSVTRVTQGQSGAPAAASGNYMLRFEMRTGDRPPACGVTGGHPRNQIRQRGVLQWGSDYWIGFALYFPTNWPLTAGIRSGVLAEIRSSLSTDIFPPIPLLAFRGPTTGDVQTRLYFPQLGVYHALTRGQWLSFAFEVSLAALVEETQGEITGGHFAAYVNGVSKGAISGHDFSGGYDLSGGVALELRLGQKHPIPSSTIPVIFLDEVRIGDAAATLSSVSPGSSIGMATLTSESCGSGLQLGELATDAADQDAYFSSDWLSLETVTPDDLATLAQVAAAKKAALDAALPSLEDTQLVIPPDIAWGDYTVIGEDSGGNPVILDNSYTKLRPGTTGAWDEILNLSTNPVAVLEFGDDLHLYYCGAAGLRVNGVTGPADNGPRNTAFGLASVPITETLQFWQKHASNPLLTYAPNNAEAEGIFGGCIVRDDNDTLLFYGQGRELVTDSITTSATVTVVIMSRSVDGVTWTEPVEIVRTGDGAIFGDDVELMPRGGFIYAGKVHLYYTANGGARNYQLGYMRLSGDRFTVETSQAIFTDTTGYGVCDIIQRDRTSVHLVLGILSTALYRVYAVNKSDPTVISAVEESWTRISSNAEVATYYRPSASEWYRYELGAIETTSIMGFTTGTILPPAPITPSLPPPPVIIGGTISVEFTSAVFNIPESSRTSQVVQLKRNGSTTGRVVALVTWADSSAFKKRNYDYFDRYAVWEDGDGTNKTIELDVFIDTRQLAEVSLTCTITSLPDDAGGACVIGIQDSCTVNLTKVVGSRGATSTTFAGLSAAMAAALPGDILVVTDGIYQTAGLTIGGVAGTPTNYIAVRSQTIGGVEIHNGGNNCTVAVNSPYWILDGVLFRDVPNNAGLRITANQARISNTVIRDSGSGSSHATGVVGAVSDSSFDKCEWDHTGGHHLDGVGTANKDRNWLYYCLFHNGTTDTTGALDYLQDATQRNNDTYFTRIHRCLFDTIVATGQNLSETWSLKSGDNLIRYCTIRGFFEPLRWRTPRRVLMHHCFFHNACAGVQVRGDGHKFYAIYLHGYPGGGPQSNSTAMDLTAGAQENGDVSLDSIRWRVEFLNLDFCSILLPGGEALRVNGQYGQDFQGVPLNKEVRNSSTKASLYWRNDAAASLITDEDNSVASSKLVFSECVGYTTGSYGVVPPSGLTQANPSLAFDSTLNLWRVSASSTNLIGKATPHADPICRRDVFMRPRDPVAPDVGCEEYLDDNVWPPVNLPLVASDVGPENT